MEGTSADGSSKLEGRAEISPGLPLQVYLVYGCFWGLFGVSVYVVTPLGGGGWFLGFLFYGLWGLWFVDFWFFRGWLGGGLFGKILITGL